ncbi:MAG TPA: hypothetical protein VGN12_04480 [Pirellulales bacterium]|jgi:hypothetical protein
MTEQQRLFLVQARADFAVFDTFRRQSRFPASHKLHYLQMATELFGKAHAWREGPRTSTHRAFVTFLRSLTTNRRAQEKLGFAGRNAQWQGMFRKTIDIAQRVEDLAPALSPDLPNPEYPWPRAMPVAAPVEFDFPIWRDLVDTTAGRRFLDLVERLFQSAEYFL